MIKKYFKLLILLFGFIFVLGVNLTFTNDFSYIDVITENEYNLDNVDSELNTDFRFNITQNLLLNLFNLEDNGVLINNIFIKDVGNVFFNDILKYKKNIGDYIGYDELDLFDNFDNKKEIRSILNFQRGSLTVNFSFNEELQKIDDYYITIGKNSNQYLGIKYFKKYFFSFLIIICIFVIAFNVYNKFRKNNKIVDKVDKTIQNNSISSYNINKNNDTELVAIIMAALSNYLNCDVSKLRVKSIKKTGWKRKP